MCGMHLRKVCMDSGSYHSFVCISRRQGQGLLTHTCTTVRVVAGVLKHIQGMMRLLREVGSARMSASEGSRGVSSAFEFCSGFSGFFQKHTCYVYYENSNNHWMLFRPLGVNSCGLFRLIRKSYSRHMQITSRLSFRLTPVIVCTYTC